MTGLEEAKKEFGGLIDDRVGGRIKALEESLAQEKARREEEAAFRKDVEKKLLDIEKLALGIKAQGAGSPIRLQQRAFDGREVAVSPQFAKGIALMVGGAIAAQSGKEGPWIDRLSAHGLDGKAMLDGYKQRVMTEGSGTAGGFLVNQEYLNDMIRIVEDYGVFRRNARVVPMGSDRTVRPRRTGGVTVYYPGEAGTITASTPSFDMVGLTAKKTAALTLYSSELDEDALIALGAFLAEEFAYAMAKDEDDRGFAGDGTATYNSTIGVRAKLRNPLDEGSLPTIANIAGLQVATTNSKTAWSNVALGDLAGVIARLHSAALNSPNLRWYVHPQFWGQVMVRLASAAGGALMTEIYAGPTRRQFLGYPVEMCPAMPSATAASTVVAVFGDLRAAAMLGDRRRMTIDTDRSVYFTSDQIAVRAIERIDINVHDAGNHHATAGSRVYGPIAGLITDA